MPISSYVAYPVENQKEKLIEELSLLNGCEVIPSENKDVLVLVTDTEQKTEEQELQKKINQISSLQYLGFVSGFDPSTYEEQQPFNYAKH